MGQDPITRITSNSNHEIILRQSDRSQEPRSIDVTIRVAYCNLWAVHRLSDRQQWWYQMWLTRCLLHNLNPVTRHVIIIIAQTSLEWACTHCLWNSGTNCTRLICFEEWVYKKKKRERRRNILIILNSLNLIFDLLIQ